MNLTHTQSQLRRAVEGKKQLLKTRLLSYGYMRTSDGKDLHELTLSELERIYENVRARRGGHR